MEKVSERLQRWICDSEVALSADHLGGLDHAQAIKRLDELARIPVEMGVQVKAREVRSAISEAKKRDGHRWLSIACNDYSVLRTTVVSRALRALQEGGE